MCTQQGRPRHWDRLLTGGILSWYDGMTSTHWSQEN